VSSAATIVRDIRSVFRAHADASKAAGMRAYMRDQFPFLGIISPVRKQLQKELVGGLGDVLVAFDVAEQLFAFDEREYQYSACDLLSRVVSRKQSPLPNPNVLLERVEALLRVKSWWDTVDALAPAVAGTIVKRSAELDVREVGRRWIRDDDFWVQRAAMLLQLKYKADTDEPLLFELVLHVASSKEFFLRKGAGWVLREYSKTAPKAARKFLDAHYDELSGLTLREASKYC
jgi:3-methyladenine DNA glycosylase AlkD